MADSTLKLLFPLFLFFVCAGTDIKIPLQYQNKCTVAENQHCFSNETGACKKGEHVNNDFTECTPKRRCCPCSNGTFQPYSNKCDSCIECKNCTKTNRKVESYCNVTHDTVCGEELPEAVTTQTPETTSHPEDQTTETAVTNPPSDQNDASVWCASWWFLIFTHVLCAVIPLCTFITFQNRSSIGDYITRIRSNWGRIFIARGRTSSTKESKEAKKAVPRQSSWKII